MLFGKLRPYLKNYLLTDFNGVAVGDFWVFRPKENISSMFLYGLIQSERYQKIANYSAGSKMPRSDWSLISSVDFKIPNDYEEQKGIGLFFNKIDRLIELKVKKIEILERLKHGYTQKLFTDLTEHKPKIRFKGFKDDWKASELGNEFNLQTGKSKFIKHKKDKKFKYPILSSTNVVGFSDMFDYEGQFLLIARVGDAGNLYKYNGKAKITDNTMYVNSKRSGFLFSLLQNYNLSKISFGTTRKLIKSSELKKIIIRLPNEMEMNKLERITELIDKRVNLQKDELERLKLLKKGYLQKMIL